MATAYRSPRFLKALSSFLMTGSTSILLLLFLVPFVYMVVTSLKTRAQFTLQNAPIWPVSPPKFEVPKDLKGSYTVSVNKVGEFVAEPVELAAFTGRTLDLYTVPMDDGSKKDMALVKGYQKGSIFLDPQNPGAQPVAWNGGSYKSLNRPWVFSPAWNNYIEMWNAINYPQVLWNTFFYTFTTTIGVLLSCVLVAFGFPRFRFPFRVFRILRAEPCGPGDRIFIPGDRRRILYGSGEQP